MFRRLPTWIKWTLAITLGIVLCVVALVLLFALVVWIFHAIYSVSPSYQLEKGIKINTFRSEDKGMILDAFHIPECATLSLTELQYMDSFRDPSVEVYVEVDKQENDAFESQLLTQYEKANESSAYSFGGVWSYFWNMARYADITDEDCQERYVLRQDTDATVVSYAFEDKIVYVFRLAAPFPSTIQEYALQQVKDDNYKKLSE